MEDAEEMGEAGAEEGEIVEGGENIERSLEAADSNTHPLEHSWTFWFDNPYGKAKQAAWGSSLRSVYTFSTVEDFWRLYNNIVQPSKLMAGSDFHCFKAGIEPKWEDPKCANGGKWTVSNSKGKQALDALWLNTLLAMIGEQFDEGDEICGAVVSVRNKQDKIALWTKNAANESSQICSCCFQHPKERSFEVSVCVNMFCEVFKPSMSLLPKEMEPTHLLQACGWAGILEEITQASNVVTGHFSMLMLTSQVT